MWRDGLCSAFSRCMRVNVSVLSLNSVGFVCKYVVSMNPITLELVARQLCHSKPEIIKI